MTTRLPATTLADDGLRERLRAVHCYAVTPFRAEDPAIDEAALASNLDWLIEHRGRVIARRR